MAVKRTTSGYQLWWYDAEGKIRKRTIKGIARDEAVRMEREILAARDRGERPPDERHAPLFAVFATQWVEESRAGWKASTLAQYQQVLKSQLVPAFSELRVSAITESRIRQCLTQLQDAGLSARRINLALLVLKMIPEAGQGYVFTGPEGGLLNVNALRDRVWYPTLTKRVSAAARRTTPGTPSPRMPWPRGRRPPGWQRCSGM